jgi:L-amino acid N-acyltransferase YncA
MLTIRDASTEDAAACAAIYAPYVLDTAISFETVPPDADEMAARIAASHVWLVGEEDGRPVGFAYGGAFNPREAYRWACSVSVYLEVGRRRTGAGRALYEALFARLADLGYRRAAAGITLPNEASAGLHAALGFETVGTFPRIGWKGGAWHDVAWMQRDL